MPGGRLVIAGRTPTAGRWVEVTGRGGVTPGLDPPERIVRPCPAAPDPPPATFTPHRGYTAPAAEIAQLPDAFVWGVEGTVVTADGLLVEDLTRAWRRPIDDHPIWTAPPELPATRLAGTTAVIAARGADRNIAHFVCDCLPRFALVVELGVEVDHWLVASTRERWQRDALDLLGLGPDRVVALDQQPLVCAERLLVPSRTGFAPTTAPWARRRLRALLQPLLRLPGSTEPAARRLLISRATALRRRLDNEADLAARLVPLGFHLIRLEDLPFAEQLVLVANAEVVVATHGAALGWILAARPGGALVEIANPLVPHDEYWGLTALAGWRYALVFGRITRPAPNPNPNHADLEVDPDAVAQLVSSLTGAA